MKANELLLWMSARRQGSWQQFRSAVEELHSNIDTFPNELDDHAETKFPLHQKLRLDFERLAHVEFFAGDCEKGWRITPPTFAVHPTSDGMRAVLCGARSPALRERVIQIGQKVGCELIDSFGVPEIIRFYAPCVSSLLEIATQAEVSFQEDAPLGILSCLPPCDPPSRRNIPSEFPVGTGWAIHEFDTSELRWRITDRGHAEIMRFGVFRFRLHFQQEIFFLRWKGATFKLPRAVALYALLQRSQPNLLRYDDSERTLSVPATCRPPLLLERALVLCSGLPPAYDKTSAKLSYCDIPYGIAQFAAQLLRQTLIQ